MKGDSEFIPVRRPPTFGVPEKEIADLADRLRGKLPGSFPRKQGDVPSPTPEPPEKPIG